LWQNQSCSLSGELKRLKKLVGISLQEITPDPAMIRRLLKAASRNLSDTSLGTLRFFPYSLALNQHIHRHLGVHPVAIPLWNGCLWCYIQTVLTVSDLDSHGVPAET
jgi:hypothetical protein